jgi:hypothetical protein
MDGRWPLSKGQTLRHLRTQAGYRTLGAADQAIGAQTLKRPIHMNRGETGRIPKLLLGHRQFVSVVFHVRFATMAAIVIVVAILLGRG